MKKTKVKKSSFYPITDRESTCDPIELIPKHKFERY